LNSDKPIEVRFAENKKKAPGGPLPGGPSGGPSGGMGSGYGGGGGSYGGGGGNSYGMGFPSAGYMGQVTYYRYTTPEG